MKQPNLRKRRYGRHFAATLALLASLSVEPSAHATKIYQWVDDKGVTHYGEKPPPGSAQREVRIRKTPVADPTVNTRRRRTERLIETFASERAEKKADRLAAAAALKKRKAACAKAKEQQEEYRNAAFIYTEDEHGERIILNNDKHADVIAGAQAEVDKWCG